MVIRRFQPIKPWSSTRTSLQPAHRARSFLSSARDYNAPVRPAATARSLNPSHRRPTAGSVMHAVTGQKPVRPFVGRRVEAEEVRRGRAAQPPALLLLPTSTYPPILHLTGKWLAISAATKCIFFLPAMTKMFQPPATSPHTPWTSAEYPRIPRLPPFEIPESKPRSAAPRVSQPSTSFIGSGAKASTVYPALFITENNKAQVFKARDCSGVE